MANINDTAYPRFKNNISEKDLINVYTPTQMEILYANEVTRNHKNKLLFLIMLKTYQRLGYFVNVQKVPKIIINHIAKTTNMIDVLNGYEKYDGSSVKVKHIEYIRMYLNIKPYNHEAKDIAIKTAAEASKTKDNDADIINAVIDELIHQRYEIPVFSTLLRISRKVRHTVYNAYYKFVYENISEDTKKLIDNLFISNGSTPDTGWNSLKEAIGGNGSICALNLTICIKTLYYSTQHIVYI